MLITLRVQRSWKPEGFVRDEFRICWLKRRRTSDGSEFSKILDGCMSVGFSRKKSNGKIESDRDADDKRDCLTVRASRMQTTLVLFCFYCMHIYMYACVCIYIYTVLRVYKQRISLPKVRRPFYGKFIARRVQSCGRQYILHLLVCSAVTNAPRDGGNGVVVKLYVYKMRVRVLR